MANYVPLGPTLCLFDQFTFLPKLLWHNGLGRHLSLRETHSLGLLSVGTKREFSEKNVVPIGNSPADILTAVMEVHHRETTESPTAKRLQDQFRSIYTGEFGHDALGKISSSFLSKYEFWLS